MIGAGLAGLAAADELSRAGVEVSVFEARSRVGGRVWSVPFAGSVVERGAEFVLPDNPTFKGIAARFSLQLVRKGTHYGDRQPKGIGRLHPASLQAALAKLAALAPDPDESVESFIARAGIDAGSAAVIRTRIEVSCAYPARDLDAGVVAEAGTAFGKFDTHTVAGGNQRLAEALAQTLGPERLTLEAPVTRVRQSSEGVVVTAGGREASCHGAVLAVPASVIGEIAFDPPLPGQKAAAHAAVRYGHAAKLFLPMHTTAAPSATMSVPEHFWCFTQLDRDSYPIPVTGAFAGTADALDALHVAAGPEHWALAVSKLRPDLELDLGSPLLATWTDDPWVRGAYSARSVSSPIDDAELTRPHGRMAFAGEHTAGPDHGTMEGALRSGIRAAHDLLARSSS